MSSDPFVLFGLDRATATDSEIKAAYARLLKVTRPDENPKGFMELRAALESARNIVRWRDEDARYAAQYGTEDNEDEDETDHAPVLVQTPAEPDTPVDPPTAPDHQRVEYGSDWQEPSETEPDLSADQPVPSRQEYGADWNDPETAPEAEADDEDWDDEDEWEDEYLSESARADYKVSGDALGKVNALLEDANAAAHWENWLEILDHEDLTGIDSFRFFSDGLRSVICQRTEHDPEKTEARVKGGLTPQILLQLDERFGWSKQSGTGWIERQQNIWMQRLIEDAEFRTGRQSTSAWGRPPARQIETVDQNTGKIIPPEPRFGTPGSIIWIIVRIALLFGLFRLIGSLISD